MRRLGLLKLGVGQHLPVGGAEPPDQRAVARVDQGLRVAGARHRRGGNRRLLVRHDHHDRAQHDEAADDAEQHAQGLQQRPVPPPAALDLDLGPVQSAAPRSAEASRASRPPRPAGSGRSAWAAAAAPAAWQLGSEQAPSGLGFPPQLAGLLGACRASTYLASACRTRVAAVPSAPRRAAVIRADRGADTAAVSGTAVSGTAVSGTAVSGSVASGTPADDAGRAGLMAVQEVRLRAAEPLGVPARRVIAQVVVDIPRARVAPIAPVSRRAVVPRRAYIAIPNVKVISFAAHAPSLVARRPRLVECDLYSKGGSAHPGNPPNSNVTS